MSPMGQTTLGSCDLCGMSDGTVSKRWAWFKEPQAAYGGQKIVSIERCDFNPDCRSRVEAQGREWPLEDATARRSIVLTGGTARLYSDHRTRPVGGSDELLQEANQ